MRILYLHQYFRKPEQGGGLRSYFLAKALVEAGHEVELITGDAGESYRQENVEGITVHYLPVAYDNTFGPGKRIRAFLKYTYQSIKLALKLKNIHLCYATSTPLTVGLVALALHRLKRVPYYFEVRDLWPAAPIALGFIKNKLLQKQLYALEHLLYRKAEKVIALSPGIEAGIKPYKPAWAIHLIPNMADTEFYLPAMPIRKALTDPFYICYIGAIGKANHLQFLLNIAYACSQNGLIQVKFIVAGAGAQLEMLQVRADERNLKNITWTGKLNRRQVHHYLDIAHATYTSFNTQPILTTTSPNKFFDSLAAGKLTIVNTTGWLQELVEGNKCGFYANPENPQEFLDKLMPYLDHPDLLQRAQQHARELAETKFSRKLITAEFVKLFEK